MGSPKKSPFQIFSCLSSCYDSWKVNDKVQWLLVNVPYQIKGYCDLKIVIVLFELSAGLCLRLQVGEDV